MRRFSVRRCLGYLPRGAGEHLSAHKIDRCAPSEGQVQTASNGDTLERSAMILHHVDRIGRSGFNHLADATFGEAVCADDIRDMDQLHPISQSTRTGLNGYHRFVNDHGRAHNTVCSLS